MQTKKILKFREEIRQDAFYHDLRDQVQQYLRGHGLDGFATWQVWLKFGWYGGVCLALYFWLLFGGLPQAAALTVWAVLGFFGVLVGLNFSHDAAHDSLSKYKLLNKVLYYLTFNALGANAYLWQMRHVQSHHLFPNVDDCDADIDDNPFIRLSPHKPLRWYHRFQYLYAPFLYLFYTLIWVFVKDFILLGKKRLANLRNIHHPAFEIALFFLAKTVYIFVMLIAPWWLGSMDWGSVWRGFLLMHFVSGYTFIFGLIASHFADGRIFPKADQAGYLELSWSKHQVAASLDYHATASWANWVFGGFNAHVAHHLFPQISHVHYPEISKIIGKLASKFALPYENTTLAGAIAAHFRYLKRLGIEPATTPNTPTSKSPPEVPGQSQDLPTYAVPNLPESG